MKRYWQLSTHRIVCDWLMRILIRLELPLRRHFQCQPDRLCIRISAWQFYLHILDNIVIARTSYARHSDVVNTIRSHSSSESYHESLFESYISCIVWLLINQNVRLRFHLSEIVLISGHTPRRCHPAQLRHLIEFQFFGDKSLSWLVTR